MARSLPPLPLSDIRQQERWLAQLEAARRALQPGSGTWVCKGRSRADVDWQIARAREKGRIGDLTNIAAIVDPLVPIGPKRLRPVGATSTVIGFPDDPDNPLNYHPAERDLDFEPPSLLTPFAVGRTTYFQFTAQWFQVALWRYLTNGGRRACVIWHRRAGKDEVAMAYLARMMLLEPGTYWILYPTIEQARTVLWSMRLADQARIDRIFPKSFRRTTRNGEMYIEFLNGSVLQFIGSNNHDQLRGASAKAVVFSEYATADPGAWPALRPMIDQNNGTAIFISTPRGQNHLYNFTRRRASRGRGSRSNAASMRPMSSPTSNLPKRMTS
jgi:hypothetical protein